ncbi:HlyD family efflux transporter periplasmic adaptor subunit [Nitrospirillum sp. BR 11164]|uniref:HlyD family efflux transporter periplasmic adaptor subunit n=1 Tax=Nitrospirillum sp. BR 11164 TaxID=3104324 RepID=UPI002AFF8476|nr:HlyD family efflux transporter periplasmic adaptor subunit [Nitrospirillum sp. BR 11164]MEA1647843.1 HlyD family efflux transporter periplasmic adaptor subunit [Nitrospirillum sp. BR 11164]
MNTSPNPLFRKEFLEHRARRLDGDIHLFVPISWHLVGLSLIISVIISVIFLTFGSYSRFETVEGQIVLGTGVATILPPRSGIVAVLHVREGQHVVAGAPLVEVHTEETMIGGASGPSRMLDALVSQDETLSEQKAAVLAAATAERNRLQQQAAGFSQEILRIDEQISTQRRLVEVAEKEVGSVADIAARGFISQRDLRSREEALLVRQQQLLQLKQARDAKSSQIAEIKRSIDQAQALANAQISSIASNQAEIARHRTDVESSRGYTIRSPISGTVTAITAHAGQVASSQSEMMTIVPADGQFRAELYIPSNAIGFLKIGQEVNLAIDAFPYQRFGTVKGKVNEISTVAISHVRADGRPVPIYLLTANLSQPWVMAYGREQPLLPGMALTARILTARQSLFRWLFEPIYAVGAR